ncbi:MAG: hypothetical protein ABL971_08460 [Vicinamibacterales bacterium]
MMRMRCQWLTRVVVALTVMAPAVGAGEWGVMRQQTPRQRAARAINGSRRGRPRKFDRPSRAVTLTLPEDVIARLQAIDPDLSLAVVRVTQPLGATAPSRPAELVSYGNRSVIMVPRSRVLRERTGVELIPISDGRALISMDERLSVPQFELRLRDALADDALDHGSRALFDTLVDILQTARKDDAIDVRERQIVVLHRRNGANGSQPMFAGGLKTAPSRSAGGSES